MLVVLNKLILWTVKLWNQMVFTNFDPLNTAIVNILSTSGSLLLQWFRRYSYVVSITFNKKGVVIFRVFAVERDFGTHPKLSLGVIFPYNS